MTAGSPMHRETPCAGWTTPASGCSPSRSYASVPARSGRTTNALESGAELGARYVIVNGDDPNIDRASGAMRLLPGEGELPLAELLAVFPEGIAVSVEAPVLSPLKTLTPV
jgi:hypothetical protein